MLHKFIMQKVLLYIDNIVLYILYIIYNFFFFYFFSEKVWSSESSGSEIKTDGILDATILFRESI